MISLTPNRASGWNRKWRWRWKWTRIVCPSRTYFSAVKVRNERCLLILTIKSKAEEESTHDVLSWCWGGGGWSGMVWLKRSVVVWLIVYSFIPLGRITSLPFLSLLVPSSLVLLHITPLRVQSGQEPHLLRQADRGMRRSRRRHVTSSERVGV